MKKSLVVLVLVALLLPMTLVAQGSKGAAPAAEVVYTPNGTFPIVKTPITVNIMVAQAPCV
ncbi:MAG TPA: ABC transporter substrate-binding protein, partial [Sphaerochaeta sp.]|nr:ABC transporter substrate-binding protein [Sphaerochaeta sp.]